MSNGRVVIVLLGGCAVVFGVYGDRLEGVC